MFEGEKGGDIFGIMLGLAVGRGWTMIRVERNILLYLGKKSKLSCCFGRAHLVMSRKCLQFYGTYIHTYFSIHLNAACFPFLWVTNLSIGFSTVDIKSTCTSKRFTPKK